MSAIAIDTNLGLTISFLFLRVIADQALLIPEVLRHASVYRYSELAS